jgi:hypothetical protein
MAIFAIVCNLTEPSMSDNDIVELTPQTQAMKALVRHLLSADYAPKLLRVLRASYSVPDEASAHLKTIDLYEAAFRECRGVKS